MIHVTALLLLLSVAPSPAQTPDKTTSHPCEQDPAYHKLDFWVGSWDVYEKHDGSKGGTDVVEKILDGCGIVENWHELSPDGADGKSLFYYQRATGLWKQVWVTAVGPIKEKKLIEDSKTVASDSKVKYRMRRAPRTWIEPR